MLPLAAHPRADRTLSFSLTGGASCVSPPTHGPQHLRGHLVAHRVLLWWGVPAPCSDHSARRWSQPQFSLPSHSAAVRGGKGGSESGDVVFGCLTHVATGSHTPVLVRDSPAPRPGDTLPGPPSLHLVVRGVWGLQNAPTRPLHAPHPCPCLQPFMLDTQP